MVVSYMGAFENVTRAHHCYLLSVKVGHLLAVGAEKKG